MILTHDFQPPSFYNPQLSWDSQGVRVFSHCVIPNIITLQIFHVDPYLFSISILYHHVV